MKSEFWHDSLLEVKPKWSQRGLVQREINWQSIRTVWLMACLYARPALILIAWISLQGAENAKNLIYSLESEKFLWGCLFVWQGKQQDGSCSLVSDAEPKFGKLFLHIIKSGVFLWAAKWVESRILHLEIQTGEKFWVERWWWYMSNESKRDTDQTPATSQRHFN